MSPQVRSGQEGRNIVWALIYRVPLSLDLPHAPGTVQENGVMCVVCIIIVHRGPVQWPRGPLQFLQVIPVITSVEPRFFPIRGA